MRTEVAALAFRGTSLLDEGWWSSSPLRACFKAGAAFFSTGHSRDTLVAQPVGRSIPNTHAYSLGNDGQRQAAQADQDAYPGGASSRMVSFNSASSGSFL